MKLKLSLKNVAKHVLKLLIVGALFLSGCSYSTKPTYLKENLEESIRDVCKKEYNINASVTLAGSTLYIYVPMQDIFEKTDKPEKYTEKFQIDENKTDIQDQSFVLKYQIKPIPEQEKTQDVKFTKKAIETSSNVWKVLRRVLFSMDRSKESEPEFYYLIFADIKNGIKSEELIYYLDLKKVSYDFISWGEYQHRSIQKVEMAPELIGDTTGAKINYKDITMKDFIAMQIQNRIKLKFQKPEVSTNANIDNEIIKIIALTTKIYDFKEFSDAELENLETKGKTLLSRRAILEKY